MFESRSHLDVVDSLNIGQIAAKAQVRKLAPLGSGLGNIRKRICARVVVELVVPREETDVQQSAGAEQVSPGRRKVVGFDLCALILAGCQCVERVRILEPGTRIAPI